MNTGSRCIETYGINVDGEGTAEEALSALRGAISKMKRKADMEDWQKAHPDHAQSMAQLVEENKILRTHRNPFWLYRFLDPGWKKRCADLRSIQRASIKYYRREGFLTPTRTAQVFGTQGALGHPMYKELERAGARRQKLTRRWAGFIAKNPRMEMWQRIRVDTWLKRAIDPHSLTASDRQIIATIRRTNGTTK